MKVSCAWAVVFAFAVLGMASGCGSESMQAVDASPELVDVAGDVGDVVFRPPTGDVDSVDQTPEWDIPNRPPLVDPIPPVTVKMGQTIEVDLAPYYADPEQPDGELELTWTAKHVALEPVSPGKVKVIGPVDWNGVDPVRITVTDGGGLSNSEQMPVTVELVDAPPPGDVVEQDVELPDVVEDNQPPQDVEEDTGKPCGWTTFTYTDGAAQKVELAGSFNNWGSPMWTMTKNGSVWTYEVQMQDGQYQYKFVVDGIWKVDPANPKQVDDGYGGKNSVLDVGPCG